MSTLCDPLDCNIPCFSVLYYILEFAQTHAHWVYDAIKVSQPLLPTSPPALNLPQPQGHWNAVLTCISGLSSFRIDRLNLLADQGTLKSLLQHHISKPSVLWCSALFMVQLSHPYMTIEKTITLTIWTRLLLSWIFQARILEWVAISSSRGSSQPRDWTRVSCNSCISSWILYQLHHLDIHYVKLPFF